jgi:hypothetical protein
MIRRLGVLVLLSVAAVRSQAQSPAADWRTVTTPHFRVHYPRDFEGWALRAASRLEAVRDAVVTEVGFGPKQVTDVVVMNPVADANGLTLPLLDAPRIVYYTEPPDPESTIGEFADWIDLLTVHETAHLVHLLRPSRNPWLRLLERELPLNPITRDAPRWVLEGYATVVEGRITGSGRPHGTLRAAILRKWALSGRLPSYAQLNSSREFLGMSMAYLAGSAYLEWLEQRAGADALKHLWARMTARQRRSFDEAFIGVFGDSPRRLYGQFTAELTANAKVEPRNEGELWQETYYDSGDPAVSPDGSKLAMVLRNDKGEAKLVVFPTGPNEEEAKLAKRIEKILARDPEDVGPVRVKPVPRKPLHTLEPSDGGDVETPRWMPDGKSLLYTHRQPDLDGFLHHDLFRWTPESGEVKRLTTLADVKDAEPLDATHAVAVRNRGGASQLVNVDLATGAVSERTPPSLDVVYSRPRVSPDGRLAWSQHEGGRWHVIVDGKNGGPPGSFGAEWGRDGTLYMTSGGDIVSDMECGGEATALCSDPQKRRLGRRTPYQIVTRSGGAARQPAAAPDGSLYFMSLEPDGFVVRHLPANPSPVGEQAPPPVLQTRTFAEQPLPPSEPYGIGRQEHAFLFGGNLARDFRTTEAGVRLGDVVGRLDTLLLASAGDLRGAALATSWRGWPVGLSLHGFSARERNARREHGAELRASYEAHLPQQRWRLDAGTLLGNRSLAFVDGSLRFVQRTIAAEELHVMADSRQHARASLRLAMRAGDLRASLTLTGARRDLTLGALPSSIVPASVEIPRIFDPALSPQTGDNYRGARVDVTSGSISWFLQHHRLSGRTIRVAGALTTLRSDPMPLLQIPGLDLTVGVARVIEERRTRAWIGLRWRP